MRLGFRGLNFSRHRYLPVALTGQKLAPGGEMSTVILSHRRSYFIKTTAMDYIAIIHIEPDADFGVSFPDFPGCITAGRTLDEAKDRAAEALTGHIEVMREG
jgi:predicted RNase H-like HicB family nuclease